MANEIKALDGDGEGLYRVLFLYPISTPKTYADGSGSTQTVVPTPAPTEGLAFGMLSSAERSALDAGDAAYEVATYGPEPDATGPEITAGVQALYTKKLADFEAWYESAYRHIGAEVDAP